MAQTWRTLTPSESTDGEPIALTTAGVNLHTSPLDAGTVKHEVVVEVMNQNANPRRAIIYWGSVVAGKRQYVNLDPYESTVVSGVLDATQAWTVSGVVDNSGISGADGDINAKVYINEEAET